MMRVDRINFHEIATGTPPWSCQREIDMISETGSRNSVEQEPHWVVCSIDENSGRAKDKPGFHRSQEIIDQRSKPGRGGVIGICT